MAVKKGLILIHLQSRESEYRIIRYKNPKKLQRKLSFRKYDPILRRHVWFDEKKA